MNLKNTLITGKLRIRKIKIPTPEQVEKIIETVGDSMTDKQIKNILDNLIIIVDTREQENSNITNYFDAKNISWVSQKLDYGDYSFGIPALLGIDTMTFQQRIVIERKNSLDELSGNIAQARERFEREMERAKTDGAKTILLVENGNYEKILEHKYRTDLNEKSYLASLFSFKARYGIEIEFISEKLSGWYIYNTFKYYLREHLKGMSV